MAKPRIFVSSTYYDLKHIRTNLEAFIKSFGYESVLFESGDILFDPEKPLDESCYNEIQNSHMQILIIGGNYGSPTSKEELLDKDNIDQYTKFNSITKTEFLVALKRRIPIYFFVDKGVLAEYDTFKKNRKNKSIVYAHVSSVNIFKLIDDIYSLKEGNYVRGFSKFDDISEWLKMQWAHLFADLISNRKNQIELTTLSSNIDELNSVTSSLKTYTEEILKQIQPENFSKIKSDEDDKLLNDRIRRFQENRLIQFLLHRSINLKKKEVLDIYNAFINTKTLKQFLEEVTGKKNPMVGDLTRRNGPLSDYEILKENFT